MPWSTWFASSVLLWSALATATEVVEFPEEELATETVLPKFERTRVVLNRNVQFAKRFELGGGFGLALNEPFYDPLQFHLSGTYFFNELHALNIWGAFFMDGLNQYGKQLQSGEGLQAGESFDPSKAPAPKTLLLGNYQIMAYYGKISLTKQTVANLSLFGTAGLGFLQTGGVNNIVLSAGFGQNFYFTKDLSARFDLRLLIYDGPDATSRTLPANQAAPSEDAFDKSLQFKTYLNLGLVYLL